jgi:hypothetical protein
MDIFVKIHLSIRSPSSANYGFCTAPTSPIMEQFPPAVMSVAPAVRLGPNRTESHAIHLTLTMQWPLTLEEHKIAGGKLCCTCQASQCDSDVSGCITVRIDQHLIAGYPCF